MTGANRYDVTQVEAVLKSRVRKPRGKTKQNLCADAGYQGKESEKTMKKYRYTPHIRPRGEEKKAIKEGYKARRWVVEVAHSWFNRFRKLLVRFEKNDFVLLGASSTGGRHYHFKKDCFYLGIRSKSTLRLSCKQSAEIVVEITIARTRTNSRVFV